MKKVKFFLEKDVKPGGVLDGTEDVEACLKQPGIPSCAVKVPASDKYKSKCTLFLHLHDGLYELRSEREALPLSGNSPLRHVVKLWCETILLPDLHPVSGLLKLRVNIELPGGKCLVVIVSGKSVDGCS